MNNLKKMGFFYVTICHQKCHTEKMPYALTFLRYLIILARNCFGAFFVSNVIIFYNQKKRHLHTSLLCIYLLFL